jgi:ribonuclease BN (tRNA processing enzyme)
MSDQTLKIARRRLLRSIAGGLGARAIAPASAIAGLAAFAPRVYAQAPAVPDSGTHLVLLGTQGGPNFHPERAEFGNAIVVDGNIYVVDCGYGTLMSMRRAALNYRDVGHVFITHLHDDHTSDLAALLSHQWTDGRIDATIVYGPYGTEALVAAAISFADANTVIRLIDEARSVRPRDIFHGRTIAATSTPQEVFADAHVTVSSVENTHFPDYSKQKMPYRALSYRFDSSDRSVVISGDTAYSDALIELARGADVFACEAMDVAAMRRAFERMVAGGAYADNPEGVWDHIVATHTSTEDAGRMAAAAGVNTLVLTHLIPGALDDLGDEAYVREARRHFDGEIIVGRDRMRI